MAGVFSRPASCKKLPRVKFYTLFKNNNTDNHVDFLSAGKYTAVYLNPFLTLRLVNISLSPIHLEQNPLFNSLESLESASDCDNIHLTLRLLLCASLHWQQTLRLPTQPSQNFLLAPLFPSLSEPDWPYGPRAPRPHLGTHLPVSASSLWLLLFTADCLFALCSSLHEPHSPLCQFATTCVALC